MRLVCGREPLGSTAEDSERNDSVNWRFRPPAGGSAGRKGRLGRPAILPSPPKQFFIE